MDVIKDQLEFLKGLLMRFADGSNEIYSGAKLLTTDPKGWYAGLQDIDPRIGAPIILVTTATVGFVAMVLLANFTKDTLKPQKTASGVVHRKGDPPIPPPTEVVSLRIYPIKSCRGMEVSATRLRKGGLTLDRNWMFISLEDRKFLTIRSDPSMTLIDTELVDDSKTKEQMLRISIHGQDTSVSVPAFPSRKWLESNTKLSTVEIWEAETDGWEYSEEINKTFSDYFKKPVALIYKGPQDRMVAVNGRKELYGSETAHHFADVMSLTIASQASINDLNRRLKLKGGEMQIDELTIERFRPNVIVRGRDDHPWEEDTWKRIRLVTEIKEESAIYKIDLDVVARCARCQVPNVNPDTAEKHPKEPWDELMKFRRVDDGGPARWKPCFAMLCLPKNEGRVKIGTKLEVLETTEKHLYNTRAFADL